MFFCRGVCWLLDAESEGREEADGEAARGGCVGQERIGGEERDKESAHVCVDVDTAEQAKSSDLWARLED